MTDPVAPRPELPDPQRDRHVAFPGDEPAGGSPDVAAAEGAEAGAARGPVVGATLPPEAWPNRPYAPSPRRRSGSPGAKLLAALVIVPVVFGFFSNSSQDYSGMGGGGTGVEMPMGGDVPAGVEGVWVEPETDTTSVEPALAGKPSTVPVPVGAKALRVEVVSVPRADAVPPTIDVIVDTTANDVSIDSTPGGLPSAATVHLDERPTRLEVSATDLSGTVQLQCRVYAGTQLVAFSTGASTVTCTPEL